MEVLHNNNIIIRSIYSPMRFPYRSIQTACYYKENPPSPYLEAKTSRVYRKNALPKLTPGKGKPISYYLLEQLFVQGFTCLYFTNISARYNAVKVLILSTLLYIRFLAPFLSFIYYLIYSSIQLVYSKKLERGILHFF